MSICKNCNGPLNGRFNKIFCSNSCSARFNNIARGKKPVKPKQYVHASGPHTKVRLQICTVCSIKTWMKLGKKVCSDSCFITAKQQCRRGKTQQYKGIKMDSGWEVELATYLDSINIRWERPVKGLIWLDINGKEHRYFPDFYLPDQDLYLDPKNKFAIEKQAEKLNFVAEHYPNVKWGDVQNLKVLLSS